MGTAPRIEYEVSSPCSRYMIGQIRDVTSFTGQVSRRVLLASWSRSLLRGRLIFYSHRSFLEFRTRSWQNTNADAVVSISHSETKLSDMKYNHIPATNPSPLLSHSANFFSRCSSWWSWITHSFWYVGIRSTKYVLENIKSVQLVLC